MLSSRRSGRAWVRIRIYRTESGPGVVSLVAAGMHPSRVELNGRWCTVSREEVRCLLSIYAHARLRHWNIDCTGQGPTTPSRGHAARPRPGSRLRASASRGDWRTATPKQSHHLTLSRAAQRSSPAESKEYVSTNPTELEHTARTHSPFP